MELKFRNLRADEIEIRRGRSLKDGRCELLCYKTYSVDCTILDETVGPENWVVNYKREGDTLLGGIAIWSEKHNAFLWKWAAGSPSDYESIKGEQADALKRAGFVWNLGRDNLYSAPRIIVRPESDYTTYYVEEVGYDENGKMKDLVLKDNKGNIAFSYHNFKQDGQTVTPSPASTPIPPQKDDRPWEEKLKAYCAELRGESEDPEYYTKLLAFFTYWKGKANKGNQYGVKRAWEFFVKDVHDGKLEIDDSDPKHPKVIEKWR